ncbi:MAG: type IV toxin-antitoxin system AbiEi family antitoxin domain-containing protein [Acidobacteriota bacterium]|nr:type IV toxin-antitoxin system AbiEi family antitoxin domain-containing protein [Acidobacteriota bacterium]
MPARDKAAIAALAKASRTGLITVEAAAGVLGISPPAASARLARLVRSGWAARVRRGLYLILPLEAQPGQKVTSEDPWVLARELFSPCYVGGWSAAEYWGLTEQLFRTTLVVTAAAVRRGKASFLGNEFRLYLVDPNRLAEGVVDVWRGNERVPVSSRERTLVDCLDAPELCGGVRHLAQLLREYADGGKKNIPCLLSVAEKCASGAGWKRLGFLSELLWPKEAAVQPVALKHISAGNARLDPAVHQRGRLRKRWRLWLNVDLHEFTPGEGQTTT